MLYFDNSATSSPILPEVREAMLSCLENANANPGRSAHTTSIKAADIIFTCRENLARLFNVPEPEQIILTHNSTAALNMIIHGLLSQGGHAVTTSFEHNSVIRPLELLRQRQQADYTCIELTDLENLNTEIIHQAVRPDTRLITIIGTSNVTGAHVPLKPCIQAAREHGIPLLIDGSQTAGTCPIDLQELDIDYFVFTGHKHLFGPQGTGGVIMRDPQQLPCFLTGGTGSRSADISHPDFPPDRFEAGTPNTPGLAGLAAGVQHLLDTGLPAIQQRLAELMQHCNSVLGSIPGISIHSSSNGAPITAFTHKTLMPDQIALQLDRHYDIACRPGIQCAPLAHQSISTMPAGTVRFSFSHLNTIDEINTAAEAITAICSKEEIS